MRWRRNPVTGMYIAYDGAMTPKRVYCITRTPYGKSAFTFEAEYRNVGQGVWEKVPLSFSSRLKDAKQYAEEHLRKNPA